MSARVATVNVGSPSPTAAKGSGSRGSASGRSRSAVLRAPGPKHAGSAAAWSVTSSATSEPRRRPAGGLRVRPRGAGLLGGAARSLARQRLDRGEPHHAEPRRRRRPDRRPVAVGRRGRAGGDRTADPLRDLRGTGWASGAGCGRSPRWAAAAPTWPSRPGVTVRPGDAHPGAAREPTTASRCRRPSVPSWAISTLAGQVVARRCLARPRARRAPRAARPASGRN